MSKRILVVAAHPDDEILGMGGTIARHSTNGDIVHILFLGNGVDSRGPNTTQPRQRAQAALAACKHLGAVINCFFDFPDNAFDSVPLLSIVKAVETVKSAIAPDIVYTHHGGDLNIDHRITCQAVMTAFRPQPGEPCQEILAFEINSATEWSHASIGTPFIPDTYVDVSAFHEQILLAYNCYEEEQRPDPHPRSPHALEISMAHRGRQVGLDLAEAFMTLRRIIGKNQK